VTPRNNAPLRKGSFGQNERGGTPDSSLYVTYDNEAGAIHPISKIEHFVEIGFLVDKNDFRLLTTFEEHTYDSTLKKYLFEFQNPIESF
jgi:hypothetical protein